MPLLPLLLALGLPSAAGEFEALSVEAGTSFETAPLALPEPPAPPAPFYLPGPVEAAVQGGGVDKKQPYLTVTYSGDQVLRYYPGAGGPFILVLPMTGDPDHRFSRSFCRHFVRNGYRCGYVERKLPPESELPEEIDALFQLPGLPPKSAANARRGLDALAELGLLGPGEPVGVAGVSLGGVDAALVAATDDRVAAAAIMLGGADLGKMLSRIRGVAVGAYARKREEYMAKTGMTLEEFEAEMRRRTRHGDPLTFLAPDAPGARSQPLHPVRYLMISVAGDPAVPNECSEALRDAVARWGSQPDYELVHLPLLPKGFKHVGGILVLPHAKSRMEAHFDRWLKPFKS